MELRTAEQIWVWSIALLCLKMFMVSFYTGWKRRTSHSPANPEDAALVLRNSDHPTADPADVQRGLGLHRNDMENIYVYMFISIIFPIAAGYFKTAVPSYLPGAWTGLNITFLVSRYAYGICYIWGLQPWRTLSFWIGQLVSIIFAIFSMVACLTG